jgi:hypothetical protein
MRGGRLPSSTLKMIRPDTIFPAERGGSGRRLYALCAAPCPSPAHPLEDAKLGEFRVPRRPLIALDQRPCSRSVRLITRTAVDRVTFARLI